MAASTVFSLLLSVTSYNNARVPSLEWYCLQSEFCTYSSPSIKSVSSPATFVDFSQYRGNLNGLASSKTPNEVTIQDGSGLYGSSCTGEDCEAVVYYVKDGRDVTAYCPIGTEMVISASGTANEAQSYLFKPPPRVTLVGEMPNTCLFVDGGYRCYSGQATLRFTRVDSLCDTTGGDCPFPLVGRTFGNCAADDPCPESVI